MKVIIGGSKGGWWGKYVVHGTKNKPRDRNKVELLSGNINIGERVTAQGKWTENEYVIVLGFKCKPPRKVVRKALKMFEKEFMLGFSKDEYHIDAVAHYDTDDTHVHIRIPKMNLLTGTQLQLYYHKKDVNRVNAIRDYINIKLDLDVSVDEKPLIAENADIRRIQVWREQQNRKPFDFTKKRGRLEAEAVISDKIKREHKAGNINTLADLKDLFSEHFMFELGKPGYDIDKGHYFRIIVAGKIHRLFGEFYSVDFWRKARDQREKQFIENVQTPKTDKLPPEAEALKHLEKYRSQRVEEVTKKYAKARGKARQERGREEARARKYAEKKESNEFSRGEDQAVRSRESGAEREQTQLQLINASLDRAERELNNTSEIIGSISGTDYRAIAERRRADKYRRSVTKGLIKVLVGATNSIKKYIVERVEHGRIRDLGERINSIRTNVQSGIRERYSELQAGIREFITSSSGSLTRAKENHQQAERYDSATRTRSEKADRAVQFVDWIIKEANDTAKERELDEIREKKQKMEAIEEPTKKIEETQQIIKSVLVEEENPGQDIPGFNPGM